MEVNVAYRLTSPMLVSGRGLAGRGFCALCVPRGAPLIDSSGVAAYCETAEMAQDLCKSVPIDTTLFSMFRADAEPQRCPLLDPPFNFTYSRNSGECAWPVSRLDGCTNPARLRLHYQACPDVPSTESTGNLKKAKLHREKKNWIGIRTCAHPVLLTVPMVDTKVATRLGCPSKEGRRTDDPTGTVEELECVADWKEGSTRYMVGRLQYHHKTLASDEERYRCFVYEPTAEGYSVAQSGDATCTGLTSATVGSRNMRLTRVEDCARFAILWNTRPGPAGLGAAGRQYGVVGDVEEGDEEEGDEEEGDEEEGDGADEVEEAGVEGAG
ncbi:Cation channel sperm-associated protein 2 [Frankliniella fusca]|uniref:Cation channel sperm-associated protein 2 n=1 Tax=Frankliniella fusca TaxID=407009 RepID=A0AAE1LHE4_9NEOP|nr:Cation channel sperm-associated protein 2 [Frankliniella fusca]